MRLADLRAQARPGPTRRSANVTTVSTLRQKNNIMSALVHLYVHILVSEMPVPEREYLHDETLPFLNLMPS